MNSPLDNLRKDEFPGKRIHGKSRDCKYEEFESRGNRKHVLNMYTKICMTKLGCTRAGKACPTKLCTNPRTHATLKKHPTLSPTSLRD